MNLVVQTILALFLLTLAVIPIRRRMGEVMHPTLVIGVLCWVVGLAVIVEESVRAVATGAQASWPNLGHILWVLCLPLIVIGVYLRREPGEYIGWRLIFDVVLVVTAWLMPIWKVGIYRDGANGLADINWVALLIMACEVAFFAATAHLATNLAGGALLGMVFCDLLLVLADWLLLWSVGREASHAVLHLILVASAVLCFGFVCATLRPFTVLTSERQGRIRGAITLLLVAGPLVLYIPQMAGGAADAGSLVLSGFLVIAFAAREAYRAYQNRTLMLQLANQARHDPLTGLTNRHALEAELRTWGGPTTTISALILDVDRFKEVNRQLGHAVGDDVLKRVAGVLRTVSDTRAFRLGGDEFAVLTARTGPDAIELAEQIKSSVAAQLEKLPGVERLAITISVGIAESNGVERVNDPLAVLTRSALALRSAKAERNRVAMFSDADARKMARAELLEERLRVAVKDRSISFIYQPIIALNDGRIAGFEALARWRDPVLHDVSPATFIPVAEGNGLVHQLGWQCLTEAVELQRQLRTQGIHIYISVNVSPVQLRRAGFGTDLLDLLREHQLPTNALTLEVTEGVFIDLIDPAVEVLRQLHRAGVGIAIDDFGSGYSSLGYVNRLPTDVLKVDRTLTGHLDRPEQRSIVEALIKVSAAHSVAVIIEGVDSRELEADLTRLGAQYAQGWLYSAGVPAIGVEPLCRKLGFVGQGDYRSMSRLPHQSPLFPRN